MKKKLVHFGAGNIGRSFIGQLFSRAGFEVVFIDKDSNLVARLNSFGSYRVIVKEQNRDDRILTISGIRALKVDDSQKVLEEIDSASLAGISVGKNNMPYLFPILASAVARRAQSGAAPLDIIIAENIRNGSDFLRQGMIRFLPKGFPLAEHTGFIETSIGKMVPIMKKEDLEQDPLWIFAEPYNTLIVDKKGFQNAIPDISDLFPADNIAAYVDRKLFIHNLGHSSCAYFGYKHDPGIRWIWEAIEILPIQNRVRACMHESAAALLCQYPLVFTKRDLTDHIEDLIYRFGNKALGDTVYRVGRDLVRKLGRDERLVGAMLLAARHGIDFRTIASAYVAALSFAARDERDCLFEADRLFLEGAVRGGASTVLTETSSLSPDNLLERIVISAVMDSNTA